ncbi:hypothetical protein [Streptomyces hokutonensis]|uniref:hypothetical protein n=1 Tax=Streptomyces hokutonensis TaxID=1306990 RepID=UPI0033FA13A5
MVKRNDPERQAVQPSANMVEWAVDQAVHGDLTTTRPANWHDTGLAAFSPQGLFPKADLTDGDSVPAQVMLGILAQESNFKQASWHSVYGDSGNVLQADWFGNGASIHYYPDRTNADCGYGIGQVTTGMSETKPDAYDTLHAGAIATDYASNISAGLRILTEKWNQLKALGMNVNNGDSKYIENWYMALWGYNSGVYTDPSAKTGLGFLNNPANPVYPADRAAFLRFDTGAAAHLADWPYQEKVLGWAEVPQQTWNAERRTRNPTCRWPTSCSTPPPATTCSATRASTPAPPARPTPARVWTSSAAGPRACTTTDRASTTRTVTRQPSSSAWGITLGDPKEEEFPGGREKTVITGDNGKGLSLLLTVTKSDELVLLDCIAENGNSHTAAFLRACAAVDAPGADPNKATTWFDQAKKETDTLYAKKKEATVSGSLTTGKLVMFVNRLTDSEQLKIFGGGTAENY